MKVKILSVVFVLLFTGCEGFLEEKSQSEIRPSTVTDMEKILEGEAYFPKAEGVLFNRGTHLFTDDMKCEEEGNKIEERKKETGRWLFSWDRTMFDEGGGGENVTYWSIPYARVKGCNLVLDYIGQMTGDPLKREYVRGEAYTLRGFYYLMLVNFFGMPYNVGDPSVNPGVPLKLVSGVSDEKFTRDKVTEVYAQIEKDLLEGARLMKENDIKHTNILRLNYVSAYALLSRMYLYKEDWDNVVKYADIVLEERVDLLDLATSANTCVYSDESSEILWTALYDKSSDYSSHKMAFIPSDELVNVYSQDIDNGLTDIRGDYTGKRKNSYLVKGAKGQDVWASHVCKASAFNNGGIRTAEVYLNRAEAYARKYLKSGNKSDGEAALADLNELRRHRFTTGYVDKQIGSFTSAEELLAFCLRERRRELCDEANHRWFDLRRTGMPKIEHTFFYKVAEEHYSYTLNEGDPRYVLPIPAKVREKNPNLEQNKY